MDLRVAQWAAERPDLDAAAMASIARLGRLARRMGAAVDKVFARHGLGRGEFDVLAALRRSGPPYRLPPGRLAAELLTSSATMTNRLGRLERSGLVRRRAHPSDRRSVEVQLTDDGFARLDETLSEHLANEQRLLAPLSARERAQLDALVRKLLGPLEDSG